MTIKPENGRRYKTIFVLVFTSCLKMTAMNKKYSYTGLGGPKNISYLHLHFPLVSLGFP